MSLRIDDLKIDELEHGTKVGEASLAGMPGTGTVQVVRNQDGDVLEVKGTWHADVETDVAGIERSAEAGEPLRYEGRLYDPIHPDRDHIAVDVMITSYGAYEFDARLPEGGEGAVRTIFNFDPVGGVDGVPHA